MSRKRFVYIYLLLTAAFSALTIRLCYLAYGAGINGIISAAAGQYSSKLELASRRGFIYDRNGYVIAGVPDGYMTVFRGIGKPQRELTDISYDNELAYSIPHYSRYHSDYPAVHLIGYLDSRSVSGVCGIEKCYDNYLKSSGGNIYMTYRSNAKNALMWNYPLYFYSNSYSSKAGLMLTIDLPLQRAVEALGIKKGAVAVADSKTGEILASASFPDYNPSELQVYLDSKNGEFINRAASAFTPGSVYKVITACALLENSPECIDTVIECTGERCYAGIAHGSVDIKKAFAQSCNQYFIELESTLGAGMLSDMNDRFGIGKGCCIDMLYCGKGAFSDSVRSNAAIGQGSVLMTPLEMTRVMCTVANNGNMPYLSFIRGFVNDNGSTDIISFIEPKKNIISKSTSNTVKDLLRLVIDEGIGKEALPSNGNIYGGKTASAQSGQLADDGREIIHSWFSGYYGKYAITVFCEDSIDGTAAGFFSDTADLIREHLYK